jgi:SAM-dependent methyltransferase
MHDVKEHLPQVRRRVTQVITDFIGHTQIKKALDIGARNPLTEVLENHFSIQIDNTDVDLDVGRITGSYDAIFCFEVLEHLFNPLHFLLEAHKSLTADGRLYLSTPKGKPHFLWFKHHFHEFHQRELIHIIERAGFKIARMEYKRIYPVWRGFLGFRPFLRLCMERKCLLELKK